MPQSGLRIVELKSYAKPEPSGTEVASKSPQQPPPPSHPHFTQEIHPQGEMPQSGLRIVELKSYAKPEPSGTEVASKTQQQPPPPSHPHFTQEVHPQGGVKYYSTPQQMIKSNSTPYSRTRYTCPYCCYFTGRKDHMTRHLNSHSGFKAFGCSWCNKKFQRKEHLKRHLIVTHGLKPDEPSSVSVTPVALGAPNQ